MSPKKSIFNAAFLFHFEGKYRRVHKALSSARQRLQREAHSLVSLKKMLHATKSEVEMTDLALSTFMRSMSNELRTPLHSTIGFAEVMHDQLYGPLGDDRYKDYATYIRDSGHALLSLVAQILELSRIQTGRYELNASFEQIGPILECAIAGLKSAADQKNIRIELSLPQNLSSIWIDPLATQSIVHELLKNALTFSADGSVVRVEAVANDSDLIIEIRDNGIGIEQSDLDLVLLPFERANNRISKERRGYGLGLALASALTKLQGGKLRLSSAPNKGTKAFVALPIQTNVPVTIPNAAI